MQSSPLITIAAIAALLVGCGSGASTPRSLAPVSIGTTVVSQTRSETIRAYAERVLPQSFASQVGDLAVGDLKVCVPSDSKTQLVRASDYLLVLADGERIAATTGAIRPALPDGQVQPGRCVQGILNWMVASDRHPTIADRRTGAQWKPNCPRSTVATVPCQILPTVKRA